MKKFLMWFGIILTFVFFMFAWLSHAGVIPGSVTGHGWTGALLFVLAFFGLYIAMEHTTDVCVSNNFFTVVMIVSVLHGVAFLILHTATGIVGPYFESFPKVSDREGYDMLLTLVYMILMFAGACGLGFGKK